MARLAQRLRDAVLQAALDGRLTEQLSTDTDASELLKKGIRYAEEMFASRRWHRHKTGQMDNELSIPESWESCQLGRVISVSSGKGLTSSKMSGEGYPVYGGNGITGYHSDYFIDEQTLTIGRVGANCGVIHIINEHAWVTDNALIVSFPTQMFNIGYFALALERMNLGSAHRGGAQPVISGQTIYPFYVPLPPLEEQQRIVDRVDELMAKIDEFEVIENELEELKASFPGEMKEALLQAAMEGKLSDREGIDYFVDIDSSFSEDDLDLLSVPDEWKWCAIRDVADIRTGLSFKKIDQRNRETGDLRILRGGNIGDNQNYILKDDDVYVEYEQFKDKYIPLKVGDVIMPSVTSIEKMCKTGYIDRELPKTTAGGFVYIIRCFDSGKCIPRFIQMFMNSPFHKVMCKPNIHKSGQAFYNLKKTGLIAQPICIPPIEEQQRIVERLDQLLPLCDELEELNTMEN